eukprot:10590922-Alexandrium_andersonii.AAC.1
MQIRSLEAPCEAQCLWRPTLKLGGAPTFTYAKLRTGPFGTAACSGWVWVEFARVGRGARR